MEEMLVSSKNGRLEGFVALGAPVLIGFNYDRCKSEFNGVARPLLEPFPEQIVPNEATHYVRCEHIELPKINPEDVGTDRGDYLLAVQFYKKLELGERPKLVSTFKTTPIEGRSLGGAI